MNEIIENFLASKSSLVESMEVSDKTSSSQEETVSEEKKPAVRKNSKKQIDDAFSALDD